MSDLTAREAPELPADPFESLLQVLDLRREGTAEVGVADPAHPEGSSRLGGYVADVFTGQSQPQPHGRAFGGQVLAQCVVAAGRTVDDVDDGDGPRRLHSLHGYFLRPGDSSQPLQLMVERMRDGRSFSARRVHAMQKGQILLSMIASFQKHAEGLDHQDEMPRVTPPEELPTVAEQLSGIADPRAQFLSRGRPVDLRHVEGGLYVRPGAERVAAQHVWVRPLGDLPDDPVIHAAVLAYCSDYVLLEPVLRHHGLTWAEPRLVPASLDHAMWFHRPPRADDWILYTQSSPSASGGRGLGAGRMFSRDGTLMATVAQEGMLRLRD